jgi:hypothetical protein
VEERNFKLLEAPRGLGTYDRASAMSHFPAAVSIPLMPALVAMAFDPSKREARPSGTAFLRRSKLLRLPQLDDVGAAVPFRQVPESLRFRP